MITIIYVHMILSLACFLLLCIVQKFCPEAGLRGKDMVGVSCAPFINIVALVVLPIAMATDLFSLDDYLGPPLNRFLKFIDSLSN